MELWYLTASYAATETLTFGFAAGVGYGLKKSGTAAIRFWPASAPVATRMMTMVGKLT
jgi:hypothetical protein